MGTAPQSNEPWVLLTGATGFVGQGLLTELLDRGRRVLCLVRAATPAEARGRLTDALRPWGRDAQREMESGRLAVLRGDLCRPSLGIGEGTRAGLRGRVESVVHAAGSTRFAAGQDGEPTRTNVAGTREVFRVADQCQCHDWHLISTAYVCGRRERADETLSDAEPPFRNDYERSKWRAERESTRDARDRGAKLTIYRPAIVVGHSETGIATHFVGVYYLFRATSLLARAASQHPGTNRHHLPLRIAADGDSHPNLVCIDDLARAFGDLFDRADARGGIYHLTHPIPPSNAQIKSVLERRYDVAGGQFVGRNPATSPSDRSWHEETFENMTHSVGGYLFESPLFDRSRLERFVDWPMAAWTDERLLTLIDYAEAAGWRSRNHARARGDDDGEIDDYFRRFLPRHVPMSKVARLGRLDLDVQFRIDGKPPGGWWCRFRGGRVVEVDATRDRQADVVYQTTPAGFWRAVSGDVPGADLFLSGDARIDGDIERAMKFAMILQEFVREFPCSRETLLRDD